MGVIDAIYKSERFRIHAQGGRRDVGDRFYAEIIDGPERVILWHSNEETKKMVQNKTTRYSKDVKNNKLRKWDH